MCWCLQSPPAHRTCCYLLRLFLLFLQAAPNHCTMVTSKVPSLLPSLPCPTPLWEGSPNSHRTFPQRLHDSDLQKPHRGIAHSLMGLYLISWEWGSWMELCPRVNRGSAPSPGWIQKRTDSLKPNRTGLSHFPATGLQASSHVSDSQSPRL